MKDARFVGIDENGRHVYQANGVIHEVTVTMSVSEPHQMVEIQTSSAIGAALDWLVGKAEEVEDLDFQVFQAVKYAVCRKFEFSRAYAPSTSWENGGPLIEKHQIELEWNGVDGKALWWEASHQDLVAYQIGDTILIAACRAIVAAKLGDTVSVPKELMS